MFRLYLQLTQLLLLPLLLQLSVVCKTDRTGFFIYLFNVGTEGGKDNLLHLSGECRLSEPYLHVVGCVSIPLK